MDKNKELAQELSAYADLEVQAKYLADRLESHKAKLMELLKAYGQDTYESDKYRATVVAAHIQKRFDSAKYKAENPIIYKKYLKDVKVKEHLMVSKINH